ncbi:hypothetical protein O988_08110 [Pseudogymnoascus sp. VKM F-3808]|nr:hypothetical protein O988_08110 [Pseudogymnoascus sp. VKM F-3808]
MFSRILSSARNIVPFNKHDEAAETTNDKKSPGGRSVTKKAAEKKSATPKSTMVTTRRQSGGTIVNPDDSNDVAYELLSTSAKKRRRTELSKKAEEDADTPTKRRKLPVRNKDETPEVTQSHFAVEIPVRELSEEPAVAATPAKSKKATPKSTPKGKRDAAVVDAEHVAESEGDDSKNIESAPVAEAPVPKPKHKKFSDNDPIEVVPPAQPEEKIEEEDEDESSDDDAPEEVGAEAAQSKAKESAREAAKAAEQKEAAERQKRKDRDAQLKAQAQAAKKRKHAEESLDESATLENSSIGIDVGRASAKPRFDRSTLPDLLPEDFLEDEESEDEAPVVEEKRQPKKIKFAYEEKKPKDKRLGSTTFRVAQVAKEGFAPKVSRTTASAKASLQGSRKGQVRKPVSSGMLRTCRVQQASAPVQPIHPYPPPSPISQSSSTPPTRMITEIATFSLLTPADLSDPSSPTTSTIRIFLSAILAADGGAHAAFFGQSVEKVDTVVLFIDWDSSEAHRELLASPAYAAIAAPLLELINPTTPVQILHVPAIPHALLGEQDDINVAEIVFFYFRSSLSAGNSKRNGYTRHASVGPGEVRGKGGV